VKVNYKSFKEILRRIRDLFLRLYKKTQEKIAEKFSFLETLLDRVKELSLSLFQIIKEKLVTEDAHQFKPIIAEIEDSPPNPIGRAFVWTFTLLIFILIVGMYFIKVDVVVSARGKIVPVGDVKVLQPLETGVILKIHVAEGDAVKKDQVLVEIDTSIDIADLEGKEKNLNFRKLTIERLKAILEGKPFPKTDKYLPDLGELERNFYKSQKSTHKNELSEKMKSFLEIKENLETLKKETENLKELFDMMVAEEARLKELAEIGAIPKNRYTAAVKERISLKREIAAKLSAYMEEKNVLEAQVSSLKFTQNKRFIKSSDNGYVHQLFIKTVGGVVTPAQPLLSILPENTTLVVKGMALNKDIGFIKEGQTCVVKVDTYNFQRYGVLKGVVKTVSPFSVEDKEKQIDGYSIYVEIFSSELVEKNGRRHKIKPGMSATIEMKVDKRRVIEFFLFPIIKYLDEGLKVR